MTETKTWQDICGNKGLDSNIDIQKLRALESLRILLKCNGFDSKSGSVGRDNYMKFVNDISMHFRDCDRIYEVGCGAGAFIYTINSLKAYNADMGGGNV